MSISFFEQPLTETLQLSDDQFVRQIEWVKDTPADVLEAAEDGDVVDLGRALQEHLGESRCGKPKGQLQSLWSESAFPKTDRSRTLTALLTLDEKPDAGPRSSDRKAKTQSVSQAGRLEENLTRWLIGIERGAALSPFEQLVLGDAMVSWQLSPRTFFKLWRILLTASIELSWQLQNQMSDESDESRLIVIAGELPWRAGHLFDLVARSKRFRERGCQVLFELVVESTDTDGAPRIGLVDGLPNWLAALVRSTVWADDFEDELFDEATEERFGDAVRRTLTLCRPDGQLPFSNGNPADTVSILQAAARITGFKKKSAVRTYAESLQVADADSSGNKKTKGNKRRNEKPKGKTKGSKKPGFQSDWAQLACLRNRIAVDSDQVVIRHDTVVPEIDVCAMGALLMHGPWDLAITVDEQPVEVDGDWTCTCWHAEKDCEYIELQLQLDEIRVDRQILLSRKQHFLMFGDVLFGAGKVPVSLESSIQLDSAVESEHDVRTREVRLQNRDFKARVIPLGLDQDRVISTPGACSVEHGRLQWSQQGECGVYSPVLIDWHPDRQSEPCEWTRLTVTESRAIVTPNIASGHRVRTGSQHLLIYRSLQETTTPRAVLGHHTGNETVVANFRPSGKVDPIVLVE